MDHRITSHPPDPRMPLPPADAAHIGSHDHADDDRHGGLGIGASSKYDTAMKMIRGGVDQDQSDDLTEALSIAGPGGNGPLPHEMLPSDSRFNHHLHLSDDPYDTNGLGGPSHHHTVNHDHVMHFLPNAGLNPPALHGLHGSGTITTQQNSPRMPHGVPGMPTSPRGLSTSGSRGNFDPRHSNPSSYQNLPRLPNNLPDGLSPFPPRGLNGYGPSANTLPRLVPSNSAMVLSDLQNENIHQGLPHSSSKGNLYSRNPLGSTSAIDLTLFSTSMGPPGPPSMLPVTSYGALPPQLVANNASSAQNLTQGSSTWLPALGLHLPHNGTNKANQVHPLLPPNHHFWQPGTQPNRASDHNLPSLTGASSMGPFEAPNVIGVQPGFNALYHATDMMTSYGSFVSGAVRPTGADYTSHNDSTQTIPTLHSMNQSHHGNGFNQRGLQSHPSNHPIHTTGTGTATSTGPPQGLIESPDHNQYVMPGDPMGPQDRSHNTDIADAHPRSHQPVEQFYDQDMSHQHVHRKINYQDGYPSAPSYPAPHFDRRAPRGRKAGRGGRGGHHDDHGGHTNRSHGHGQRPDLTSEQLNATQDAEVEAMCIDQNGSRRLQSLLENTTRTERLVVIDRILQNINLVDVCDDIFGNYVVQRCAEYGTNEQRRRMVEQIGGKMSCFAMNMCGCRVIQALIENSDHQVNRLIFNLIEPKISDMMTSQNGNHVVQKAILNMDDTTIAKIVDILTPRCIIFAKHGYGCRVMQRLFEKANTDSLGAIFDAIMNVAIELVSHQYGNYVLQHVACYGRLQDRHQLADIILADFAMLSTEKFASNVVEKCLSHVDLPEDRLIHLINQLNRNDTKSKNAKETSILYNLVTHRFANYVMQRLFEKAGHNGRLALLEALRPCLQDMSEDSFGKHLLVRFEKGGLME